MRAQQRLHLLQYIVVLLLLRPAARSPGSFVGVAAAEAPAWHAAAAARSARAARSLAEAPAPSATECAAAWSLPYARRASLGDYPRPLAERQAPRLELFILFVVDPPVLLTALRSLLVPQPPAGGDAGDGAVPSPRLALNVTVLDTSPAHELSDGADAELRAALLMLGSALRVHTPLVPLDFQRAHNAVQELAYRAQLDGFYVMHSDATVAPGGAASLVPFAEAMLRARWQPADVERAAGGEDVDVERPLGIVFFSYDTLALFNPAATLAAGVWDTNFITNYGADVDYYHRMGLAGFREGDGNDARRVGAAAAALGRTVVLTHETSHSLKSARWACTREMRMKHTFEGEWRERYMDRKWGRHRNASVAFGAGAAAAPAPLPPPAAAPAGWHYAGCFREGRRNGTRALSRELPHAHSVAVCVEAAAAAGLHVAAVQNGNECWGCNDGCDFSRHGKATAPCPPMGGPWLMQIYTRSRRRLRGAVPCDRSTPPKTDE